MPVELAPVPFPDKADLKAMMDPYLVEHADQVDPKRLHGDPTAYDFLDLYWVEPARRPYWIVAEGVRAGFCLVNAYAVSGRPIDHAMAEFSIAPEHRRAGLGLVALRAVLARHPGQWELQVYRANTLGFGFWSRALAAAKVADWEQIVQDDRVIHRFRTA